MSTMPTQSPSASARTTSVRIVVIALGSLGCLIASAAAAQAAQPNRMTEYQRQCRFNDLPEDPNPRVESCQRAALYFAATGPKGYAKLYADRACSLSTKRSCRVLLRQLRLIAASSIGCASISGKRRRTCRALALHTAHLAMPPMQPRSSEQPLKRMAPTLPQRSVVNGAKLAKGQQRARNLTMAIRVADRCLKTGKKKDCLALALHHVFAASPKIMVEAATRAACATRPMSCPDIRRAVSDSRDRLSRCSDGNRLACELARSTLRRHGLRLHLASVRPESEGAVMQTRRATAWTPSARANHRFHREACRSGYRPSCGKVAALELEHRSTVDSRVR